MKVGTLRKFCLVASVVALGLAGGTPTRAADELSDSPRYAAWAKFKPETTVTLSGDTKMGPNEVHMDMVRTLKSVTAEQVEVETSVKVAFMGHTNNPEAKKETIPAKEAKPAMKETGEKDVQAMGKTYKCKVYEISGADAGAMGPGGARPHAGMANAAGTEAKATIYVNDDVPGGLVKMESPGPMGAPIVFTLTATETK